MKTTTRTFLATATLALALLQNLSAQDITINQFKWMEGSWVMKDGKSEFYEHWARQSDHLLTGKSYMLVKGDTVMRELLRIEKVGRHWVYIAAINKDEPTLFTLKEAKGNALIFENKEHNYPQRIAYEQKEDGSLMAWIEGKLLGKVRKEEYPMVRVKP